MLLRLRGFAVGATAARSQEQAESRKEAKMARRGAGLFLGGVWLGYEKRTFSLPTVLVPLGLSHVGEGRGPPPPPPPVRFFPRTLTLDPTRRNERERLTNDLPMSTLSENKKIIENTTLKRRLNK